jgi:hypothetical protein
VNRTSITQEIKARIDKWYCMEFKKLLHGKRKNIMEENLTQLFIQQRVNM